MTRHDLLHIHPGKTSWQETMALAPEVIYSAAPRQNDGHKVRICWLMPTKCRLPIVNIATY